MSTVKAAFHSIAEKIRNGSIFKIIAEAQDRTKEIRYSTKNEFTEKIVQEYFNKEINLDINNFDMSLLKNPYFYNE